MMLEHIGEKTAAEKIQSAIDVVIAKGYKTDDMGGESSCSEIAEEIIANL